MRDYKAAKVYVKPGQRFRAECPHSEVCMHMRCAGKIMEMEFLEHVYSDGYIGRSVQLYTLDGKQFSMPIGTGEAGLYEDEGGFYYYPPIS